MVMVVLSSLLLRSDKSEHSSSRLVRQCNETLASASIFVSQRITLDDTGPDRAVRIGKRSRHEALMHADSSVLTVSGHSSNLSANLTHLFPVSSPKF